MAQFPTLVAASGTFTISSTGPLNAETVTCGGKTYTFQSTLTDVDGNVKIGGTINDTASNLAAAINLGSGSGTAYAASTTLNPRCSATVSGAVVTVTARIAGTIGNLIAITAPATNVAASGSVLSSGSGVAEDALDSLLAEYQMPASVYQYLLEVQGS